MWVGEGGWWLRWWKWFGGMLVFGVLGSLRVGVCSSSGSIVGGVRVGVRLER